MPSLGPGKSVGRYVLQQRLGDGGHAEVWAAQQPGTQRRVALKFMHMSGCATEDAWRVLRHEAEMAQRLDHPGVLRMDAPERDGGTVFLPMEYAPGGDVRALRGAPWQKLLPVLLQVAEVLEHAHSRGVVHRDIKPGNVLFNDRGAVKLTDFGTAARTGSMLALADGSPFSASPQQLRGDAATTADDIYGLGALAYELLSRYPPYYPDFDARRVQGENPARPVPVHPAPAALLDLVMRMLERDPAARPDLRQVIDGFGYLATRQDAPQLIEEAAVLPQMSAASKSRARLPSAVWLIGGAVTVAAMIVWLPRVVVPSATPARDGLARTAGLHRNERNAADAAAGADLERRELWSEAIAHYRAVLERDGTLLFAQDGLARSIRRAALDRDLQDYLDRAQPLATPAVRTAAGLALARGEATRPRTGRLTLQLQRLQQQLQQFAAPVQVEISSDNNTVVSVASVGDLGIFIMRQLALPPGTYAVTGRREGFRDVRMDLSIAPGQQHAALLVRCTERI